MEGLLELGLLEADCDWFWMCMHKCSNWGGDWSLHCLHLNDPGRRSLLAEGVLAWQAKDICSCSFDRYV